MPLVGAAILPHGCLLLDPEKVRAARPGTEAMHKAVRFFRDSLPDTIVLITPHGLSLEDDFAIYLNQGVSGDALWENDGYDQFKAKAELDLTLSQQLLDHLKAQGVKVQGITAFAKSTYATIRWGEVVPLYFLQQELNHVKYVLVSVPQRRNRLGPALVPELQELEQGRVLGSWIQQRKERIAIAISGDLAHTHRPDVTGKGPYGYSSTAQPFDESILHWVESLKTEELTEKVLLVEEELGSRQSHSGRQESYSPLH